MQKKITSIFLLIILFSSCEKKTDWNLQNDDYDFIIIEGIITNKREYHEIKITKSVDNLNEVPLPVTDATVNIYDGKNYYLLEQDSLNGIYKPDTTFIGVINKNYILTVDYQGDEYTAQAQMLPALPIDTLSYTLDSTKKLYYINYVAPTFSDEEDAMYEINLDWSHLPEYQDSSYNSTHAKTYYYTLSSIDVSEVFAPERETIFFPKGTIINEKKYSLGEEHSAFIRSLLFETEWRGGYFDSQQGNVKTNITGGGLGFFGACTLIKREFVVE